MAQQASRICKEGSRRRVGVYKGRDSFQASEGKVLSYAAVFAGGDLLLHSILLEGWFPRREGGMDVELLARAVVSLAGGCRNRTNDEEGVND